MQKYNFLSLKKLKNTGSAQLCTKICKSTVRQSTFSHSFLFLQQQKCDFFTNESIYSELIFYCQFLFFSPSPRHERVRKPLWMDLTHWCRIGPTVPMFNPLAPRVQKMKIRNFTLNRLLIVEFLKKMGYLGAHYSERQGLMG